MIGSELRIQMIDFDAISIFILPYQFHLFVGNFLHL